MWLHSRDTCSRSVSGHVLFLCNTVVCSRLMDSLEAFLFGIVRSEYVILNIALVFSIKLYMFVVL